MRERHHGHRREEDQQPAHEDAVVAVVAAREVALRVDGRGEEQDRGGEEGHARERVEGEPGARARRGRRDEQGRHAGRVQDRAGEQERRAAGGWTGARRRARPAPAGARMTKSIARQSFSAESFSVSSEANSRLMWNMTMPITKTADEQVEQHAGLDHERHDAREEEPEDEDAVLEHQVAEHLVHRLRRETTSRSPAQTVASAVGTRNGCGVRRSAAAAGSRRRTPAPTPTPPRTIDGTKPTIGSISRRMEASRMARNSSHGMRKPLMAKAPTASSDPWPRSVPLVGEQQRERRRAARPGRPRRGWRRRGGSTPAGRSSRTTTRMQARSASAAIVGHRGAGRARRPSRTEARRRGAAAPARCAAAP